MEDEDEDAPAEALSASIHEEVVLIKGGHILGKNLWTGWIAPTVMKDNVKFVLLDKQNPRLKAYLGGSISMVDYLQNCRIHILNTYVYVCVGWDAFSCGAG